MVASGLLIGLVSSSAAQDWPQWRGPARDGVAAAFDVPATWPDTLRKDWSVEIGLGYASPVLIGDRLYLFTRQEEDEVVTALDAATGEAIWRTSYAAAFDMNYNTARHRAGPKSTPSLADGRLFTHGMTGTVAAFDAASGEQLWQYSGTGVTPRYHTAMSPLVVGDLVIVYVGGHDEGALTAFDAATGTVRWSWDGDGPAYGSPTLFDLGGTRQVVVYTQEHFVGVSLTGELLWSRPFNTRRLSTLETSNSQTPILYGDLVIETGIWHGVTAFRVIPGEDGWTTEDVWHTDIVSLDMTNAVVNDDILYGLSHRNSGQYFGLDLDTGEVLWTSAPRQAENASILRSGDTILSLEDDAELVVLAHSRSRFSPVKRYAVGDSETWTAPTLSGNRLFIKDVSSLTLWTVIEAPPGGGGGGGGGGGRNRPPQAVGSLADRSLTVGGAPLAMDVAAAFMDPDGDALSYSASASSPVVSADVAGSTLTLTPVAVGEARVTVTAVAAGAARTPATQSFTVSVACTFEVAPVHRDVLWNAATGEISVTTAADCAWTATSGADFVMVTPAAGGTGSGTVVYTVAQNADAPRTATLTVAGQRVTVYQASPTVFTDHPIRPGVTRVKAIHFLELRARVETLRRGADLAGFPWTDPNPVAGVTPVRLVHLTDLRTALDAVHVAGELTVPDYTNPNPNRLEATHIMELRSAVLALE